MAIDWNKTIIVFDEDTVEAICGKEILFVRGSSGGGGSTGYIVSATKIGTEGTTDIYRIVYSDGIVSDIQCKRNAGIYTGGDEIDVFPATVSDKVSYTYNAEVDTTAVSLDMYLRAAQQGSGTPSSENIRPFIPIDGVDVFLSDDLNLLTKLDSNLDPASQNTGVIVSAASGGQVVFERWNNMSGAADFENAAEFELFLPAGTYYLTGANFDTGGGGAYLNIRLYEYGTTTDVAGQDWMNWDVPFEFTLSEEKHLSLVLNLYHVDPSVYTSKGQVILRSTVAIWRNVYSNHDSKLVINYCNIRGGHYRIDFPEDVYGGNFDIVTGMLVSRAKHIAAYTGTPDLTSYNWRSDRDVYHFGTNPTIGAEVIYDAAPTERQVPLPYVGSDIFTKDRNLLDYTDDPNEPDMHYLTVRADSECIQGIYGTVNFFIPFADIFDGTMREAPDDGGYYLRHNKQWVDYADMMSGAVKYYLDAVNGSDTNSGTSASYPFKTMEKALSVIPKNMLCDLYIYAGTYSSASHNWIHIKNQTINMYAVTGPVEFTEYLIIEDRSWVTLYGYVDNSPSINFAGGVMVDGESYLCHSSGVSVSINSNQDQHSALTVSNGSYATLREITLNGTTTRILASRGSQIALLDIKTTARLSASYASIISYTKDAQNTGTIYESTAEGGRIFTGVQESFGEMAFINDAPSNSKEYVRKNGAWAESSSGKLGGQLFYVDATNGSDNNDGLSAATAFKTLQKACNSVDYGRGLKPSGIYVAGGTYGEVDVSNKNLNINLTGNVTMGHFIADNCELRIWKYSSSSYSLTLSQLHAYLKLINTNLYTDCELTINSDPIYIDSSGYWGAGITADRSKVVIDNDLTITVDATAISQTGACIRAYNASHVYVKDLDFTSDVGIDSRSGAIVAYDTLTGTMTTETVTATGGRIYSGAGGGGGTWGSITGTLGDQTDLQNALDAKADKADIAPEFDPTVSYAINDLVYYQGTLYRFTSAHAAGAWSSSVVTAVSVADELKILFKRGLIHCSGTIPQGSTKTFSSNYITQNMVVVNAVFGTPSNVTSDVTWTTADGSITFAGTFAESTTITFDLIEMAVNASLA